MPARTFHIYSSGYVVVFSIYSISFLNFPLALLSISVSSLNITIEGSDESVYDLGLRNRLIELN